MNLEYGLFLTVIALVFGLIKQFLPDFPLGPEVQSVLVVLFAYVLGKLGINLVGKPAAKFVRSLFGKK